jgi:hypothetical protein
MVSYLGIAAIIASYEGSPARSESVLAPILREMAHFEGEFGRHQEVGVREDWRGGGAAIH